MRSGFLAVSFAALVGCGGSSNDVSCGDGTMLADGTCQVAGSACGAGTMLVGSTCVAVGSAGGAPTVSAIAPPDAGIYGGRPFKITGTNFDDTAQVFFGDTTKPSCQAAVSKITSTEIDGEIPSFCALNVNVSVITSAGMATTPFHYDALFAAEGDGGGNSGGVGKSLNEEVYLLDPQVDVSVDLGSLTNGNALPYGIDAWTFDATGQTLLAFTTGDSPLDASVNSNRGTVSIFFKVDVATGAITSVGNTVDPADTTNGFVVSDAKLVGGTLYGWAYKVGTTRGLVTIAANGNVAVVGTLAASPANDDFLGGGMTPDATGAMNVAANGAGSDTGAPIDATGELDTVNLGTGALTKAGTLDWAPPAFGSTLGSPIRAMDLAGGAMYAVLDNGAIMGGISGETLAVVTGSHVTEEYELPSEAGYQPAIDALAAAPTTTTATTIFGKATALLVWQTPDHQIVAPHHAR